MKSACNRAWSFCVIRQRLEAKEPRWRCFDELRPSATGTPAQILDGIAEVIRQPMSQAVSERLEALIEEHNVWIRGEARRLGLIQ